MALHYLAPHHYIDEQLTRVDTYQAGTLAAAYNAYIDDLITRYPASADVLPPARWGEAGQSVDDIARYLNEANPQTGGSWYVRMSHRVEG